MTWLPVTWLHVTSFPVRAASGDVTSSNPCVIACSPLLPPKYALSCPEILLWNLDLGGSLLITHEKISKDGKVLAHLVFQSKVLAGPLTDLSAWVGFCTSSPQQGVKYQLWYLIFFYGGGSLWISHEKYIKDGKVLDHLEFKSKVLHGPLTDLSSWVGFCISSPQLGVKYQLWYLIFFLWRGGLY